MKQIDYLLSQRLYIPFSAVKSRGLIEAKNISAIIFTHPLFSAVKSRGLIEAAALRSASAFSFHFPR